ncbi:interleukin 7 [Phyllostomus discolor]|uniref:Interleukin-7 n=1 Tax=Phyllostomus discolor TaxID=89673 RepID=A0A833ZMD4_9CHIR|nr:interleukin 7 [Phyllostomus discolor]
MFHVSFRYIFGIPPLILVLLPVTSSDCEIEGKNGEEYQHIIMVSFKELEHIRENASNCLNNEPNFLKRHSCDDDKEEKKSLREQKRQDEMCFLKILLEKIKTCWNKILRGTKEH